jgi:hemoglobin/transferrin/lactoferrin receptor protein
MKIFLIFLAFLPIHIYAQQSDTVVSNLNEVLVNAYKFPEKRKRVAQSILTVNNKSLLNFQANSADVLINTGAVFVQKSQQGGGSPIIRGFEASRILLMVDGVRLNNAIYRTGHLQNIITVDNMVLDRMDVLYGPSSTLFGSDALGGVISITTKNPQLSSNNKTQFLANATARYSSAIEEARTNVQLNIGSKKVASFSSITYGSFGDIIQGSNRHNAYPDFGKNYFVVQRFGNVDSALINPNPNRQSPSGFKQIDVTQKFLYQPNSNTQHILNVQLSNTNNIPRYDRLSETVGAAPAFAEWYYGPQFRNLVAYNFSQKNLNSFFKQLNIVANYQAVEESRVTRRFKSNNKDFRWERVDVFGFTLDAKHEGRKHEVHAGLDANVNFVSSTAERVNILSGAKSRIQTRYSDGPTSMSNLAIYGQYICKFNDQLTLNSGLRLNLVNLNARFADTSIMHLPFNSVYQKNIAVTGNLGLVYSNEKSKFSFLLSSGFRSPNVDDLSKVFETNVGRVVLPNLNLKPEFTYNIEASYFFYSKKISFGTTVFNTWFTNAIAVDKFNFNGQDSINYNGIRSLVVAPQNKASATISGFSVQASTLLFPKTSMQAVYTYTFGRYANQGITVPLDHVPPAYGRVSILHKQDNWQVEVFSLFNGWKRLKDYSPSGEDNFQYATADGMPSWITFNARVAAQFNKAIAIQASLENILDIHYRYFASGISAPGRNFIINVKYSF